MILILNIDPDKALSYYIGQYYFNQYIINNQATKELRDIFKGIVNDPVSALCSEEGAYR